MFVPLAKRKANMVCLIVAFIIPCWLVALSLKIVWVGTPACWNNSSPSYISSKILLSSCSNWVRLRISGSVSPFPPMLDTFLSVSSILGLVVLFTPVTQSLLAIPKMAEMYSLLMDAFFQPKKSTSCSVVAYASAALVALVLLKEWKVYSEGSGSLRRAEISWGTMNTEFLPMCWVVNISVSKLRSNRDCLPHLPVGCVQLLHPELLEVLNSNII